MSRFSSFWLAAGLAVASALASVEQAHAAYVLTEVSRPGAAVTALFDVNNNGTMVGYSQAGTGPNDFTSAFVYDGSAFVGLTGPAGAAQTAALGISDGGTIVGSFSVSTGLDVSGNTILGPQQGFIYDGASYATFNIAGAIDTFLRGISPDGRYISGYYSTSAVPGTGFVYDTLSGTTVTVSVAGSQLTIAQGINASYTLVGSDIIDAPPTSLPGFSYDILTSIRTDVSIAGAQRTALRTIDDAGVVGGWFRDSGGAVHGFVGSVSSFEQIDFAGASSTFVEGSNNAGVLVGTFIAGDRSGAFVATPVPEPGTLALVLVALGVAAGRRRAAGSR